MGYSRARSDWCIVPKMFKSRLMTDHQQRVFQVKLVVSEYQTSGVYAKRAKQATKKDNAAACLCFLNYLTFPRRDER
jgi:hypothetical protein